MAVTRFYRPQQQEYISQFVPENLGVMQNALSLTQRKADETQKGLDVYEDELLKRNAFGESDTAYLKGKREEFDKYISDLSGQDLSNSKVARDAANYIRKFKSDEGLQKVQGAYEHNLAAQKAMDKLRTENKYNPANVADYLQSARQYSQTGFAGDPLADSSFFEDVDVRKGAESLVNNLKASGYTYDQVKDTWIDRKSGKGVSRDRIMQVMSSGAGDFLKTQAGQQLVRNSRYAGESINDAYKRLAGSIADEYAYNVSSNTFRDNTARLKRLGEMEASKPAPLFKPGFTTSTAGAMGLQSMKDVNKKVSDLETEASYTGNDPVLIARAKEARVEKSALESDREFAIDKMNQTFTQTEKDILRKNPVDLISNDKVLTGVIKRYLEATKDVGFAGVEGVSSGISGGESMLNVDALTTETKHKLVNALLQTKSDYNIEDNIRREYASSKGMNYDKLRKSEDDFISNDKIIESDQILFEMSKDGNTTQSNLVKQIPNYIDDINFEIVRNSGDATIDEVVNNLDVKKYAMSLNNTTGGEFILHSKPDEDGNVKTIAVVPKDKNAFLDPNSAANQLAKVSSSNNQSTMKRLQNNIIYKDVAPVHERVNVNMINDVINLSPEVELNNEIVNPTEYFLEANNIQSMKYITKPNGSIGIIAEGGDPARMKALSMAEFNSVAEATKRLASLGANQKVLDDK